MNKHKTMHEHQFQAAKKQYLAEKPRKKKKRRTCALVTPSRFRKAVQGTHGNRRLIAEKLECSYGLVQRIINTRGSDPRWQRAITEFYLEQERVLDLSENAIIDCIKQEHNRELRLKAATWMLTQQGKQRGYGDRSRVIHEGGENPIRVNHAHAVIPFEALKLPVKLRKDILRALDTEDSGEDVIDTNAKEVKDSDAVSS
jgi:hypothetical protein